MSLTSAACWPTGVHHPATNAASHGVPLHQQQDAAQAASQPLNNAGGHTSSSAVCCSDTTYIHRSPNGQLVIVSDRLEAGAGNLEGGGLQTDTIGAEAAARPAEELPAKYPAKGLIDVQSALFSGETTMQVAHAWQSSRHRLLSCSQYNKAAAGGTTGVLCCHVDWLPGFDMTSGCLSGATLRQSSTRCLVDKAVLVFCIGTVPTKVLMQIMPTPSGFSRNPVGECQ